MHRKLIFASMAPGDKYVFFVFFPFPGHLQVERLPKPVGD